MYLWGSSFLRYYKVTLQGSIKSIKRWYIVSTPTYANSEKSSFSFWLPRVYYYTLDYTFLRAFVFNSFLSAVKHNIKTICIGNHNKITIISATYSIATNISFIWSCSLDRKTIYGQLNTSLCTTTGNRKHEWFMMKDCQSLVRAVLKNIYMNHGLLWRQKCIVYWLFIFK